MPGAGGGGNVARISGRGLAWRFGAVEVRVEADQSEVIALGDNVLVGVIEVEPLGLHGGGDGREIRGENGPKGNLALDEQVGNELVQGGLYAPGG